MSHLSMILSSLFMMAMLLFIAPNVFAFNRGHILRNVALWLAIFLGLALFYQNFGPSSPHPLFGMPAALSGMHRDETPKPSATDKSGEPDDGKQGFTPPSE
jgi:hypothetical protein